jgi:hypothetical protein
VSGDFERISGRIVEEPGGRFSDGALPSVLLTEISLAAIGGSGALQ